MWNSGSKKRFKLRDEQPNLKPIDSITPELVNTHSEINIKNVEKTIDDLQFTQEKILVCGTGASSHPKFNPRFVTPSAMIQADNASSYITGQDIYVDGGWLANSIITE